VGDAVSVAWNVGAGCGKGGDEGGKSGAIMASSRPSSTVIRGPERCGLPSGPACSRPGQRGGGGSSRCAPCRYSRSSGLSCRWRTCRTMRTVTPRSASSTRYTTTYGATTTWRMLVSPDLG